MCCLTNKVQQTNGCYVTTLALDWFISFFKLYVIYSVSQNVIQGLNLISVVGSHYVHNFGKVATATPSDNSMNPRHRNTPRVSQDLWT